MISGVQKFGTILRESPAESKESALLLLHLQNDVVSHDGAVGRNGLAEASISAVIAAGAYAEVARVECVPVIHVVFVSRHQWCSSTALNLRSGAREAFVSGSWGVEPVSGSHSVGDEVVEHDTMSAFAGTPLAAILTSSNRHRVYLAGVSTHLVVAATAFAAADLGLTPVVLAEGCAAPSLVAHEAALAQLATVCGVWT